jgi:hypothetical protein
VTLRDDVPDPADELVDRWRLKAHEAGTRAAAYLRRVHELEAELARVDEVRRLDPKPPRWAKPKKVGSTDAVIVAMLSDLHLDEVVRAEDMGGVNEYNRAIAEVRLRRWAEKLSLLPTFGPQANVMGLELYLGGDLVNGDIHEGAATNADTLLGTMLHWSEHIAAAIDLVAQHYDTVNVSAVVGNHGRMTPKPRYHLKARDNADWHLSHLVGRAVTATNVRFTIPETPDCIVPILGRTHVLTHGDETRGGSGIGGIWPPIKRMVLRKMDRYSHYGHNVEHVWLGHWHTHVVGDGFTVNGSMVGYDPYAAGHNLKPEPAQQLIAYVTERGVDWSSTLVVDDVESSPKRK